MTLFIIPIVIRVSAGALTRGATTAIGRWAGGNVAKKYIATAVAKKAIDEGRKMALGQSEQWRSAFREDPAQAMRDAAVDFVNDEARDVIAKKSEINRELLTTFREEAVREVGREIVRRTERRNPALNNTVIDFNQDAVADRTTEALLSRNLPLSIPSSGESSMMPIDEALNGNSGGIDKGRSLATYADNPIETEEVIRTTSQLAYYEAFDERALTYTVVGRDDLFAAKVRSPLEAIMTETFDINES